MDDYNKITLVDRPQEFANKDYWELSKIFKNRTQRQLFQAMHKMFVSTPDDDEVEGRFNKFKKSIGNFWNDYNKNRWQPNFKEDFSGKPCIYFLKVFGVETQNEEAPAELTADTPMTFRNSDQHSLKDTIVLTFSHQKLELFILQLQILQEVLLCELILNILK